MKNSQRFSYITTKAKHYKEKAIQQVIRVKVGVNLDKKIHKV